MESIHSPPESNVSGLDSEAAANSSVIQYNTNGTESTIWSVGVVLSSAVVLALFFVIVSSYVLFYFSVLHLNRHHICPFYFLAMNLGVVDVLMAVICLPLLLLTIAGPRSLNCRAICTSLAIAERTLVTASIWNSAFISVDRYWYIIKHGVYKNKMTYFRCFAGIVTIWILAFVFGGSMYFVSDYFVHDEDKCSCHLTLNSIGVMQLLYTAVFIVGCFIFPATLIIIFYGFVMQTIYERPFSKNPFSRNVPKSNVQNRRKHCSGEGGITKPPSARIFIVIIVLYLACYSPYFIVNIMGATGYWQPRHVPPVESQITILVLVCISACNPFLYGFANLQLRRSLIAFIRLKFNCTVFALDSEPTNEEFCVMGGSPFRRASTCSEVSALSTMTRQVANGEDSQETPRKPDDRTVSFSPGSESGSTAWSTRNHDSGHPAPSGGRFEYHCRSAPNGLFGEQIDSEEEELTVDHSVPIRRPLLERELPPPKPQPQPHTKTQATMQGQ